MRCIICSDCAEYRNEWCEKVLDSPVPDMLRDCQYYHEKDRDLLKVVRCKDCRFYDKLEWCALFQPFADGVKDMNPDDYCSRAERREDD